MVGHDAVADGEVRNACADTGDSSGHLVAEDARAGVGAGVDLFEVGAADAAGVDSKEEFAGADLRDGDGFGLDVVDAAVDGGLHGLGYPPGGVPCPKFFVWFRYDCRVL